jgi:hypothetical protein
MNRPIGVTLLAIGAGLAGLYEIWRALVFMGIVNFTFLGAEVSFPTAQWGQTIWALLLAAIWFWVAVGFWNVRAYAWSFGIFVSIFTLIFGFMAVLFNNNVTMESEFVGWFLALVIFFYLNYPGVREHFVRTEMAMLTPEQRAAYDQLQAANMAAAQAQAGAPAPAPAAPPPPAAAPPPAAPPSDTGGAAS